MQDSLIVRVARIEKLGIDTLCASLVSEDGSLMPAFSAGAHIDVHLPCGVVRQYSLCGDPDVRTSYEIAVKREAASRGGSAYVHDSLNTGDQLRISRPRNNFSLSPTPGHHILLAGGIGLTPLLSMMWELARRDDTFELFYFARSMEHASFLATLDKARGRNGIHLCIGLDPDRTRGHLHQLLRCPRVGTHLYACGPGPFISAVRDATKDWPDGALRVEAFTLDAPLTMAGGSFEVELAKSKLTFSIEENRTIAETLRDAGVEIELSCEQGVCGTCLTRVLEGVPDHRDMFLSDSEKLANDSMLICVSRAKSRRVVLDL
jgi:vanillate O-demethylase ferredoxin subunit